MLVIDDGSNCDLPLFYDIAPAA